MHKLIFLIPLLAASASGAAAGPAPMQATITAAPAPDIDPEVAAAAAIHHRRQDPSPTTTQPPQTACDSSLTALLSSFPSPTPTALSSWAVSSAPIQRVLRAIQSNYAFPSLLLTTTPTHTNIDDVDINALCTAAASLATAPSELSTAYSAYLDSVQMWRYAVEGDAYALAERCGGEVGLGLELLMATEAAMCTSGLRESVRPWVTGVPEGGEEGEENAARAGRVVRVGLVLGVVGVVGGLVWL